MNQNSLFCNCGSGKNYSECCEPLIKGYKEPQTPEALMRSRYTAYTKANITYITKTMRGKASIGFDATEAKEWAKRVKWQRLEIIETKLDNPNKGIVEFKAFFEENGQQGIIHEISEFQRKLGLWYYVNGKHIT